LYEIIKNKEVLKQILNYIENQWLIWKIFIDHVINWMDAKKLKAKYNFSHVLLKWKIKKFRHKLIKEFSYLNLTIKKSTSKKAIRKLNRENWIRFKDKINKRKEEESKLTKKELKKKNTEERKRRGRVRKTKFL
jgi:primosomal protein N'